MTGRFVSPILMWIIVLAGIAAAVRSVPVRTLFGAGIFGSILLIITIANWLHFFLGAISVNLRPAGSAAAVDRLTTTGVYAKVRHPIYSADIFLAWGIFVSHPALRTLVSVLWLTAVLIVWMKLEEAALSHRFSEEYAAYKAKTPMIIPSYSRRS